MTRVVQCLSHSIESYDQLRLYTDLGIEAVDIGGYIDPRFPHDPKRPPVPDAPFVPEIKAAIDALGTTDNLGAAQSWTPDAVLDWLGDDGVLIYHHYLERLFGQWDRIRDWKRGNAGRRVIWRTVGQSVEANEKRAAPFRADGLEIVRYSPKERNIPSYAGEDALIRFYKDPDEWTGWTGHIPAVINITQHLAQRDPYTNYGFWRQATEGLNAIPMGPGSEAIGGPGEMTHAAMKQALRDHRAYLYTGTQPASYTLGLIEAMMTGIPVYSIGPKWMSIFPYGPDLFEGHEIAMDASDDPSRTRARMGEWLDDLHFAQMISEDIRERAIELFGKETIGAQWAQYLGVKVPVHA
jgi:hypothetical protein